MTNIFSTRSVPKLAVCTVMLSSLLSLSACQKPNEGQEDSNKNTTENTTVVNTTETSTVETSQPSKPVEVVDVEHPTPDSENTANDASQTSEAESTDADPATGSELAPAAKAAAPASEVQLTDVEYKDSNGRSIHVTFQTSATDALQASLRMPSGKRILLTAPPGQGNNPTYRSADGSIELVTHGGGSKIDLLYENETIKFDAVKTDAEVIKPKK